MKLVHVMATLTCLFLLAGCASPEAGGQGAAGNAARNEIVNPGGEKVSIPLQPKRIADLSGSTEELLLLGMEPVATGNIDYGNRAEFSPTIKERLAKETVNLGWYAEPISLEAVMAVEPDLILLGPLFNENLYEQLSKMAPTIKIPHPYYEWRKRLDFLADTFEQQPKKEQWLSEYAKKTAEWKQKLGPILKDETFVVVETYPQNLVIYSSTGAAELIYSDLGLKRAEGIPAPEHWGGIEISLEALSALHPQHLLLMENSENKLSDSKVWKSLEAVQKGNVYKISNVDNYNYSYTAIGRMQLLDKLGNQIVQVHGQKQ